MTDELQCLDDYDFHQQVVMLYQNRNRARRPRGNRPSILNRGVCPLAPLENDLPFSIHARQKRFVE